VAVFGAEQPGLRAKLAENEAQPQEVDISESVQQPTKQYYSRTILSCLKEHDDGESSDLFDSRKDQQDRQLWRFRGDGDIQRREIHLRTVGKYRSQSVLPAEVVITDDGSSDRTVEIIQQFASTAPFPVKLSRNEERLGYADNFFKACRLCSEQPIAFCDQDDKWLENKLATCVETFKDPEVLLCVHSGELWYGTNRTGKYYPRFHKRRTFARSPLMRIPCLLIRDLPW
jgi:cellulose synthase/poly-beta-1,6-N-acetylglucosamine synthase-like glycosyltransferase